MHLWNCPIMYSSLFSGPSLRTLEGIVTCGVPSSRYVGSAALKRFLDDWFMRAAHGKRRVPSSLSTGGGKFSFCTWEVVWTGHARCSFVCLRPLTIDSLIVGQKQVIWLRIASVTPSLGVAGSGGVGGGLKRSGFDHAPIVRTKTVSFACSSVSSSFSETASSPFSPSFGEGFVDAGTGGGGVGGTGSSVSDDEELMMVAGGGASVSGGRVTVAEGDLSSFSSTDINGGETEFGFDDQQPRYGHRGSVVTSCCRTEWSPVTTSEDLDPSPVLLGSSGSMGNREDRARRTVEEVMSVL